VCGIELLDHLLGFCGGIELEAGQLLRLDAGREQDQDAGHPKSEQGQRDGDLE
jgi:hypothetical protein